MRKTRQKADNEQLDGFCVWFEGFCESLDGFCECSLILLFHYFGR